MLPALADMLQCGCHLVSRVALKALGPLWTDGEAGGGQVGGAGGVQSESGPRAWNAHRVDHAATTGRGLRERPDCVRQLPACVEAI